MPVIDKITDGQAAPKMLAPQAQVSPNTGLTPPPVQPPPYSQHLRRVIRRPFELRTLRSRVLDDAAPLAKAFAPNIETISGTETADFAFSVAELAFRLDHVRDEIFEEEAQEGLEALSHMARMYEHIFILQAEG